MLGKLAAAKIEDIGRYRVADIEFGTGPPYV